MPFVSVQAAQGINFGQVYVADRWQIPVTLTPPDGADFTDAGQVSLYATDRFGDTAFSQTVLNADFIDVDEATKQITVGFVLTDTTLLMPDRYDVAIRAAWGADTQVLAVGTIDVERNPNAS